MIESLCFEGGSIRSYSYIGAIEVLYEKDLIKDIKNFVGSSSGSIFAALLAIGYTQRDFEFIKKIFSFSDLKSGCCLSSFYNVIKKYGLHPSSYLESKFRMILNYKIDPDTTLKQLFEKTQKELTIVSCCLNRMKPVYFHHAKYPNVKLIDALVASCCIPLFFRPCVLTINDETDYYVDGGITDNYALWLYNDIQKLYNGNIQDIDRTYIKQTTLGLKLLDTNESNTKNVFDTKLQISGLSEYAIALINTLMLTNERSDITNSYISQTIGIDTKNINFLDFFISDYDKKSLIDSGRFATELYFVQKENESKENELQYKQ